MLRRSCFLCVAIVALLATLSCGQGRMALLVTRAAEQERNTPGDVRASASGYALIFSCCGDGVCDGPETAESCPQDRVEAPDYEMVSITTLTTDGGRVDWSHDGEWIYYDQMSRRSPAPQGSPDPWICTGT